MTAAGFVVDFRERSLDARDGRVSAERARERSLSAVEDAAVGAGQDVELADLEGGGSAVGLDADGPIGEAAEKQIAALCANIRHCRSHASAEFLLQRRRVLVITLGEDVISRIRARLVRSVARSGGEAR